MALAAFDGTPDTRFDGCRDILPNLGDLAGLAVDDGLVAGIRRAIGRARGCYHLSTLVLTSASLLREVARGSLSPEASWTRRLTLSGSEVRPGRYRFQGEILDERPKSGPSPVRLLFEVEAREMELRDVAVSRGDPAEADRESETLLQGMSLAAGFAPKLLARAAGAEREPVREVALGLSSIVTQVLIAEAVPGASTSIPQPHRAKDTCWMWRQGGALQEMEVGVGEAPPR